MDETPVRQSLKRRIIGGVLLGLIGMAILRLLSVSAPLPPLVAGLDGNLQALNDGIDSRVRERFPAGSAEAAMVAELGRQGFARKNARAMQWHRAESPCARDVTVSWEAADGRIVSTAASYFHACSQD